MGPVGDRTQSRTRFEHIRCGEHGHQGQKSAVASAVRADPLRIHAVFFDQESGGIDDVIQVFSTHMTVNGCPAVPAVACTSSVIDIHNKIAIFQEDVVEHVFPVITAPAPVGVLKVASPVDEDDCGFLRVPFLRPEESGIHIDSITGFEGYDFRVIPVHRPEFLRGGKCDLVGFGFGLIRLEIQLWRPGAVRMDNRQVGFIR